jgi:hypothetical protein
MKTFRSMQSFAALIAALLTSAQVVCAQTTFDSGSNGSFGPIDATAASRTLQIPADGIFHCTAVNVGPNRQLQFIRNATNTPIYILATGDVTIGGSILISGDANVGRRGGDGGPGGFAGGQGGPNPSDGFGPGGGKGGWGATQTTLPAGRSLRGGAGYATAGTPTGTGGSVYGNPLLIPLTGGSGGGGADETDPTNQYGGGGGGGAILIASNTRITFNQVTGEHIYANGGGSAAYGGGSGGAVRLVAPTITGTASVLINGSQGGGFGRIRVDALSNSLNFSSSGGNSQNYATFGANMVVFPQNLPELRVIQAAGTNIAPTQVDPVFVLLPAGAPATQTVTVQAKNFNAIVPLVAVVTPEAGDRATFNFEIDNTSGAASSGSVQVQIPAGVSTRIDVWTR